MRKVFEQAQYQQQSTACIQALHRLVAEFEFDVFYEEFCRNTKCALKFEHANPAVQNVLTTISSFLLSAKQKYSTENLKRRFESSKRAHGKPKKSRSDPPVDSENEENDENDENRDLNNRPTNRSENESTDEIVLMMNESAKATRGSASPRVRSKAKQADSALASPDKPSNAEQELQKIYRLFRNLLDFVISDVLLPFLGSVSVDTRQNAAFVLLKLVNVINDLDVSLFGRLRNGLLERLIDKSPKVRCAAAKLLYRFQDHQLPNDAVQDGLMFHLKYDSSAPVRLTCLNVILANKDTLPAILSRVRDPNDHIREKAFDKLANKLDFKEHLNGEQRMFLIRNGLNDRSAKVCQAFQQLVVPAWVRAYANSLVELLRGLDLLDQIDAEVVRNDQANSELIERFLTSHFESSMSGNQSSLSKLHLIIVDFCKHHLDDEFLMKNEHANAETFFLWRALIKFLKSREEALDRLPNIATKRVQLKREFVQLLEIETERPTGGKVGDQLPEDHPPEGHPPEDVEKALADETVERLVREIVEELVRKTVEESKRLANSMQTEDAQSTGQLSAQKDPLERSTVDENNNETCDLEVLGNLNETANKENPANREKPADDLADLSRLADAKSEQEEDLSLLDLVMPKFSRFICFFRSFCEHLNLNLNPNTDEKDTELLEHRFMFRQLIGFMDNYEIADDSQKKAIVDLVEELFELNENTVKIAGYTELIMNFAYQAVYRQQKLRFFEYSMGLLQRLEAKINLEEQRRNEEQISAKEIHDLELENANKSIRMHELKDQLDEAVAGGQYDRAHELQQQIEHVKLECNRLIKEIQRMKNVLEYQENRRKAQENGEPVDEFDIANYPIEHIKLLQIFEVALRNGLNNFHALVNYGIERYVSFLNLFLALFLNLFRWIILTV